MKISEIVTEAYLNIVPGKRRLALCAALAAFFSSVTLFGRSFYFLGSASAMFATALQALLTFLCFILISLLYLLFLFVVFKAIDEKDIARLLADKHENSQKRHQPSLLRAFEEHPVLVRTLIILACYLPFLVILYPGNVPHDAYSQINQFMGIIPLSNGHPVASTMIMGSIFSFGRFLVDDNFGVFLYVLIQSLAMAYTFAKTISLADSYGFKKLAWFGLVFFAVCPIWPIYAATMIKDTMFLIAFVAFCLRLVGLVTAKEALSPKSCLTFVIVTLLVCWTRHNGIYVVVPSLLLAVFTVQKTMRKQSLFLFAAVVVVFLAWSSVVLPILGVEPSPANEMMSIPYQQTARYVIRYADEITDEEKRIIDTSINYDLIPELYNPELSDPIKWSNSFYGGPSKEYLILWCKMFFRHPFTYISASFHNTYGYYYPFENFDVMRSFQLYIKGDPVATGDFDIHYLFSRATEGENPDNPDLTAPKAVIDYVTWWRSLPVIRSLTRPGVYLWGLLVALVYLLDRRQYAKLPAIVPSAMLFCTCLASPVNGLLRYAMPYMASTFLLLAFALKDSEKSLYLRE
ncbi:MAG: DUF6020 family protein [Coriobacteriia bacterium]|nr:DUF6020 family protein [Coriobacteriia bacterium]